MSGSFLYNNGRVSVRVADKVVRKKSVSLERKFNAFDCLLSYLFTAYGSKYAVLYNNIVFIITDSCVD